MTSPPSIRRLASHEWRRYRSLRLRALADSPESFATTLDEATARGDDSWRQQVAEGAESTSQLALVAEVHSRLVGLAWFRLDDQNRYVVHAYQMWVAPEFRRLGIARELLNGGIRWALSVDARHIVLEATCGENAAMRLYEAAGFKPVGDRKPLRASSELLMQPMQLDLRAV